jgi:tight adherence protein B
VDHAVLLEAVARSLRGGQSLSGALIEAAGTVAGRAADQLVGSARLLEAGLGTVAVVEHWVDHEPDQARILAGAALALGAEVGGAHARSLDSAAASLRDRAGLQREVRALTSQARASAAVMVLAPLGFATFTSITEPRVGHVLVGTMLGWGCVGAGLVLDLVGAWWMARLAGRLG